MIIYPAYGLVYYFMWLVPQKVLHVYLLMRITLSNDIKDILVGIMLGDGHIVKRSHTANSRLVYAQTAPAHKEYFNYVYNIFKPFCVSGYMPQSKVVRDNRTKKIYSAISFTTPLF